MVRPSGPVAVEFLQAEMADVMSELVKGVKFGINLWSLRSFLRILRVWELLVWVEKAVNCLLKRAAIADGFVQVVEEPSGERKVIGWLGGGRVFLPERDRIVLQNCLGSNRMERELSFSLHLDREWAAEALFISVLRAGILGSAGFVFRRWSRVVMRSCASGPRDGEKFLM